MGTNKEVIFNSLSFGSLILAKRAENTSQIEKGHRNGPFLVIGRKDDDLLCLYATSKEDSGSLIKMSKNNYNLDKDTYITSSVKLISINEFIASIYYLSDREKKNLIKFLCINGINGYGVLDEPRLEVGDIFYYHQYYYLIVGEKADNYITIRVEFDNDDAIYNVDYKHEKLFLKNRKYRRVAFLSVEETNKCIMEFKEKNNHKKYTKKAKEVTLENISPLQVGNLIVYKNILYYLYFDLGDKKLSFSVSKNQISASQRITINGDVYYANFGSKRDFDAKQENVLLVATATEEEKQLIKTLRNKKMIIKII